MSSSAGPTESSYKQKQCIIIYVILCMDMLTMYTKQVRTSLASTSRNSELCDFMFEVEDILSSFEALVKKKIAWEFSPYFFMVGNAQLNRQKTIFQYSQYPQEGNKETMYIKSQRKSTKSTGNWMIVMSFTIPFFLPFTNHRCCFYLAAWIKPSLIITDKHPSPCKSVSL